MSSQETNPKVPNPYELTEADAQKLGYVNFDLKTLELVEELSADDFRGYLNSGRQTQYIVDNLLNPIETVRKFYSSRLSTPFKNELVKYFQYMHTRLLQPHVTYLDVYDEDPECDSDFVFDFASFGTWFWQFLTKCNISRAVLSELSMLIYRYLCLHPQEILQLREKIVKARLHFIINPPSKRYKSVEPYIDRAFMLLKSWHLFNALSKLSSNKEQLDYFCKSVGRSYKRMSLADVLLKVMKTTFPKLELEFDQIGQFVIDQNIDYNVLHFQLSFDISDSKILDRSTLSMVLNPIVQVMKKVGFQGEPYDSFRSVVFDIDAAECDDSEVCDDENDSYDEVSDHYDDECDYAEDEEDNCPDEEEDDYSSEDSEVGDGSISPFYEDYPTKRKLIISISSESSSFCKLVLFNHAYAIRFAEMVLLLKYYFARSTLLLGNVYENEPFILLIIWFLQQTKPPVLPTLDELKLTEKKSKVDLVQFSTDSFELECANHQSVGELVVEFIDWFCQFDFDSYFLNPCDGKFYAKQSHGDLFHFDSNAVRNIKSYLCIVNPFSNSLKTIFTMKTVIQWKKVFGKLKDDFKIDSTNCVLVLANPDCFIDPKSLLTYMESDPLNPYKLKPENAEKLEYPENVDNLKLEPAVNPFENDPTSSLQLAKYQFCQDFIFTSEPMSQLLKSYSRDHLQVHYRSIILYFHHLQFRLLNSDLSYDDLIEKKYDYAAYGERFWMWLTLCKLFPENYLRSYSILIFRYLQKFPENILNLRTQLRNVYLKIVKISHRRNHKPQVADSKLIAFTPVDANSLHRHIKKNNDTEKQIDFLLNEAYNADQTKQFVDFIVEMINTDKHLASLKLYLEQTEVLDGGYNILMDEFNFVVKFANISEELDANTFSMALHVVKASIATRFELEYSKMHHYYFRFKLSSTEPSSKFVHILFSNVDLNMSNMLLKLSQYDKRFGQMFPILRYWLCLNKFNNGNPFDEIQFAWLIVHFLQQTSPPVLPLNLIKNFRAKTHIRSTNKQSTSHLIVEFLLFCTEFDFYNQVICPQSGISYSKKEYCKMKGCEEFDEDSWSQVEIPLLNETISLIGDEDCLLDFVDYVKFLFCEEAIFAAKCIEILTDPNIKKKYSRI